MPSIARGRLLDPSDHPPSGERFVPLAEMRNVVVEQILSSDEVDTSIQEQTHDEWVVVLAGQATLDVDGDEIELTAGDWVLLPARTPHQVVRAVSGTSWLAVHVR